MCGIVGVAGLITPKAEKAFRNMLIIDVLRGPHSTGIIATDKRFETNIHKKAMLPNDFLELKRTNALINDQFNCALVGHNRYATVGGVSNTTAHPFECGNIVGVHNGTLKNRYKLIDSNQFSVDSENLYHHMNEEGLQSVFDAMAYSSTNAWALSWINKEEHSLNFLRNSQRPLCYALSKDGKTIYFASEWWMLHGCLSRNDIEYEEVKAFSTDVHYRIALPTVGQKDYEIVIERNSLQVTPKKKATKITQTSGKSSNIVTGKDVHKQNVINAKTFKDLREAYAGETLDAYVVAEPEFGKPYFELAAADDPTVECRVYLTQADCKSNPEKQTLFDRLMSSINYFSIKCTKVTYNKGNCYLRIDWRSIEEKEVDLNISDEPDKKEDLGECAFCGDPLVAGQFHKATRGNECFCNSCLQDKQTFQTIHNMGYDFDATIN